MIHWNLLSLAVAICTVVAPGASQLTPKEAVEKITNNEDLFQVVQSIQNSPDDFKDYIVNPEDQKTLLMLAAQWERSTVVNALLEAGANVNSMDLNSKTALIWAIDARASSIPAVTALLEGDADVSLPPAPLWSPLHHAAKFGASSIITAILQKNPDVNREDADGKTPLIVAADYSQNVLQLLIDAGADVDHEDDNGYTALMKVINPYANSNVDSKNVMCDVLLNANANPDVPAPPLWGPLHLAASDVGLTYIVKKLIDAGANVNRTDNDGKTPMMVAAERGHTVLDILADAGADVNQQDYKGNTAMIYNIKNRASFQNHEALVSAGANIELPAAPAWSPLHLAASRSASEITKSLIANNADINRQDYRGITPLIAAVAEQQLASTDLIEAGADVNHMDVFGDTALIKLITTRYSSDERKNMILKELLAANASVHLPKAPANSPLHWAARNGGMYIVKSLIDAGAEVDRSNNQGRSPLITAAVYNSPVMQPLVDAGANVDLIDYDGKTALVRTIDQYHPTSSSANDILNNFNTLIETNASVSIPGEPFLSPLHHAAGKQSKYIIEKLLEAGAPVDREDKTGDTPLMAAAKSRNTLLDLLISAGANVNHINHLGYTPIMAVCDGYGGDARTTILDTLLQAGGDPNRRLGESQSALHHAAEAGDSALIKMLVVNGASLTAIDSQGYTPLMATSQHHDRFGPMKLLLDSGSDVNALSYFGGTLIHRLVRSRDTESLAYAMKFCPNLLLTDQDDRTPEALAEYNSYSEITDILQDSHDSVCVYQMQVYEEGQHRCESTVAYICNGNCGWDKIPLENTNCSSSGCQFTCSPGIDPVCGSNGVSYATECLLNKAACIDPSITLAHKGNCGSSGCYSTTCPPGTDPVCGSNGVSYATECLLNKAACVDPSITLAHKGNCDPCYKVCPATYEPVCGSDGDTFPNECSFLIVQCRVPGLTKAHDGPCDDPCYKPCPANYAPVCGSDGATYPNECELHVAQCKNPRLTKGHDGPCGTGPVGPSGHKKSDKYVNVYVNVH
ncbi:ankyrin repeat domain-containing protein 50-like isoform X2 [Macrobrachium rosenbergii]|uniref:ankyrin repeat domain-containing protein 50-like isoform X2 n=1 Tax=Macrobrachium rosenbergii TaxID=79674 RepID=UPI0034D4C422